MMKRMMISATVLTFLFLQSCSNEPSNAQTASNEPESRQIAENVTNTGEEEASGETIQITKADFLNEIMNYEENPDVWKYKGDKPSIVDFYADWCAPCRITSPILEELAQEYAGKINIYKVDTDEERELAAVFGIQSIPSFLYIPMDGQPVMTAGIAKTKEETKEMFREQIDQILLNPENK